jgi:hypothetical protein
MPTTGSPHGGSGPAAPLQRVQRGRIQMGSRCGGKSFGIRRKIGGESKTSMRIPEILWETPALRPWGKGLAQVPDQYPRENIPTPQISPPRRGRRSKALAGYGVQPGRGPRRFGVVVRHRQERPVFVDPGSIPPCRPDRGQPHEYSSSLPGSLWPNGVGSLPAKSAHHMPRPFGMSIPLQRCPIVRSCSGAGIRGVGNADGRTTEGPRRAGGPPVGGEFRISAHTS